jgi:DNA polymerase III delta prime subunit
MARFIPPVISKFTKSPGERDFFQKLCNDPLTSDWVVVHTWDIANHPTHICGEVDFICIIPNLGVLCVEVKAHHSIERRPDGMWVLGSAQDQDGPFKQAANARYATWAYISQHDPSLRDIVFWSCVAFTQVDFCQESAEWHSWQIVNKYNIQKNGLSLALARVLTQARKFLQTRPTASWFSKDPERPTKGDVDRIADILRPHFEFFQSPRSRLDEAERELKHFTEAQFVALDRMESNPRIAFLGPAGCGKSLLALESARRSVAKGKRTLLVCYNRLFSRWLRQEAAPLGGKLKAGSLHSVLLEVTETDPRSANPTFWSSKLPQLAVEKLHKDASKSWLYDKLIVDEAQDILAPRFIDCLDLMLAGGLLGGSFYLFGDFENQTIVSQDVLSVGDFRVGVVPDLSIYRLNENCRNRPRVGDAAKILGRMRHAYSRYLRQDDRVDPVVKYFANEQQSRELLVWAVNDTRTKGYLPHEVTVLFPSIKGGDLEPMKIGNISLVPYTVGGTPRFECDARYSTIRRFKGLESRAIILMGFEDLISDEGADLFYTACTRTTDVFYFLTAQAVKGQIERIITRQV